MFEIALVILLLMLMAFTLWRTVMSVGEVILLTIATTLILIGGTVIGSMLKVVEWRLH